MRRFFLLVVLVFLYGILEGINWICFALDEMLFPRYRKTGLGSPLFVVGMPRTASTFLHQTLHTDTAQFTTMKSWEIVFAPSIVQKKWALQLSKADKLCRGLLFRPLKKMDALLFSGIRPVHQTSFFEIEEDDLLLMHIFSCNLFALIFPRKKSLQDLGWFDDRLSEKRKKYIMRFFRMCIRKHLYVYGKGRTYLSKSPYHTSKMLSLRATFPGSRFLCLFRSPAQVLPSTIKLMQSFVKVYGAQVPLEELRVHALRLTDHWMSYPLKCFNRWPSGDYMLLDYAQLSESPEMAVTRIYKHFGYTLSDDFTAKLKRVSRDNQGYHSNNIYSVSGFGLDEAMIRQRYQSYYEEYVERAGNGSRPEATVPFSLV